MLRSVVLPAPLGPITERISPRGTSRLTRVTACTPPKAFDTSRISSCELTTATAFRRRGPRPPPPRPPPERVAPAKPALERRDAHAASSVLACRSFLRSRQPPLATAVVLDVAVALALPDARQPEVELLDVL